jgi:nucleoside-specific outer membrane channel protein Tsx
MRRGELLHGFIAVAEPSRHPSNHGHVGTSIADPERCAKQLCPRRHLLMADGLSRLYLQGSDMKLTQILFAAALTVTATQAHADGNFSDTWIGVRDALTASNPGAEKGGRNVNKVIVNLGHFDVWDYGTNFFSADILFSNPNEPAVNSSGGSTEFYGVYRGQLSPDKIFGINTKFGPFTAINFEFGGDAETENTAFAPNKKLLVAGPNFNIGLPAGFLDIGVHISKEWNHNGLCADSCSKPGGPVDFHATPEFELVWLYSLKGLTGLPFDFRGFTNIILPKGKDGFGNQTVTEVLSVPRLNLDLGTLLYGKAHKPDVFFQIEFWENKFGNDHTKVAGSEEVAPTIGIEYHF